MASARKGQVPVGWNQYCLSETIGGSIKIKNFSRHGNIRKMLAISLYVRFQFTSTHSIYPHVGGAYTLAAVLQKG